MHDARDHGFTLLEVLVAFIITALALAALYEGGSGAVASSATAAKYQEALALAQSHIAQIGHGAAIADLDQSDNDGDGFSYRVRVTPALTRKLTLNDNDRADNVNHAAAILYDIEVIETWHAALGKRSVRLVTRRFDVHTSAMGG